jgi:hypothetical protein
MTIDVNIPVRLSKPRALKRADKLRLVLDKRGSRVAEIGFAISRCAGFDSQRASCGGSVFCVDENGLIFTAQNFSAVTGDSRQIIFGDFDTSVDRRGGLGYNVTRHDFFSLKQ